MVRIAVFLCAAMAPAVVSGNCFDELHKACNKDCEDCLMGIDPKVLSENKAYPPENLYTKGDPGDKSGPGEAGGTCTCPDGQTYKVGGLRGCRGLACVGGTEEKDGDDVVCNDLGDDKHMGVVCAGAWNPSDDDDYRLASSGGWGGVCTCPDGNEYGVGDNGDACGSLACWGGTAQPDPEKEGRVICGDYLESHHKHMQVTCGGTGIFRGGALAHPEKLAEFKECVDYLTAKGMRGCDPDENEFGTNCQEDKCSTALHAAMDDPTQVTCIHKGFHDLASGGKAVPETNVHKLNGRGGWGGRCKCPDGEIYQVGDMGDACNTLACFGGETMEGEAGSDFCYDGGAGDHQGWEVTCKGYVSDQFDEEWVKNDLLMPLFHHCGAHDGCKDTFDDVLKKSCLDDANKPLKTAEAKCCKELGTHAKCAGPGYILQEMINMAEESAAKNFLGAYEACSTTAEFTCAYADANCPKEDPHAGHGDHGDHGDGDAAADGEGEGDEGDASALAGHALAMAVTGVASLLVQ